MIEIEGAHRLSPAEREVLRLRVVAALESGQVEGYRQAAEVFGVSERSVGTWWRAYRQDGRDGLATRKRRPGPAELITPEDRATLFTAMANYTPEELLIGGPLWTLCLPITSSMQVEDAYKPKRRQALTGMAAIRSAVG